MKTLTRKNLSDLARVMLQISEREQRSYVGGGSGTYEDPYTIAEFDMMCANGTWNGGYVEEWGYTFPDVTSYGYYGGDDDPWGYYNPYNPWGYYGDGGYTPPGYYPGSGDPGFPGDNSGYGGYGYGYDYYYDEHYDYGYYGGGGGDSGGDGNGNEDPQITAYCQQVEELAPWLTSEVGRLGIDISGIPIEYTDWCGSNARYHEGIIQICAKGLNDYDQNDLLSIVLHEAIHQRDDIPADMTLVSLVQPFDLHDSIPPEYDNFLRELNSYGDEFFESEYDRELTIGSVLSPEYYLNEINAYQKEIDMYSNVSAQYDIE